MERERERERERELCCWQMLARQNNDVVKRWVNEAQEAVNSDNIMVQVSEQLRLLTDKVQLRLSSALRSDK